MGLEGGQADGGNKQDSFPLMGNEYRDQKAKMALEGASESEVQQILAARAIVDAQVQILRDSGNRILGNELSMYQDGYRTPEGLSKIMLSVGSPGLGQKGVSLADQPVNGRVFQAVLDYVNMEIAGLRAATNPRPLSPRVVAARKRRAGEMGGIEGGANA